MRHSMARERRWLFWFLLAWFVAGCANIPMVGSGDEGNIGEIGEKEQESPADIYVDLAIEYMKRQQYSPALRNTR